jgi:broad specificity phosphatase PhoE
MTRFLLIRHGSTALMSEVLCGRMPGVGLNAAGEKEATLLAEGLSGTKLDLLIASPQTRARETAAPIQNKRDGAVQIREAFDEVDFGAWTGRSFSELAQDPSWLRFNSLRSFERPPGGESLRDVQYRAMKGIDDLSREFRSGTIAIVTHADVIRAIVTLLLGIALDMFLRIRVDPASVTGFELGAGTPSILCINADGIRAAAFPKLNG